MSLLKFITRIQRIDNLIIKECTGPSDEFASKVGISRSMLMDNLREMRELGAKIEYCPRRKSYFYESPFELVIGNPSKRKLVGGREIQNFFAGPTWALNSETLDAAFSFSRIYQ
jgi:biotin operon repressor